MDDWTYPATWKVGDTLDADTLNTRIRDPNGIILRRPLTVATSTSNQTMPTSGHGNTVVTFNNIIQDDDGMVLQNTPMSDFYAQRTGTYQVWYNLGVNALAAATSVMTAIAVNGSALLWENQVRIEAFSGTFFSISTSGLVYCTAGEYIEFQAWNGSATTTMTIAAVNNTPRIAIMWLGPQ